MKKIAMIVLCCFLATFVAGPAFARNGYYGYGYPTEKWGNGGKWEEKNSSPGDKMKWGVLGVLGLVTLGGIIWLGNKILNQKQNQPVYQSLPPTYHPDAWPRGIEPPTHQNQPAWQQQPQPAPATYNIAEPF